MKKKTIKLVGIYTLVTIAIVGVGYGICGLPEEASASADYEVGDEAVIPDKDVSKADPAEATEDKDISDAAISENSQGDTGKGVVADSKEQSQDSEKDTSVADVDEAYKIFDNSLFIGDSRTEGFMYYAGVDNANYYCGKSMTVDKILAGKPLTVKGESITVYDALEKKDYDMVFISAGLNELGWYSIDSFLNTYGELIDAVKEKQPNAKIYLQAILPVTAARSENDTKNNNTQIYWYNVNIIDLANQKDVYYINAAPGVVDSDGYLHPDSTSDGIHLNKTYCEKWAKYLAAKLKGEVE